MLEVVHSYGVSTSRFVCGLIHHEVDENQVGRPLFMGALGSNFVEWDLKTKEQRRRFHAHEDMIVCMALDRELPVASTTPAAPPTPREERYFVACSFGGEVAIWDFQWKKVSNTLRVGEKVEYAEWRGDRLIVVTHEDTAVAVISVREIKEEVTEHLSFQLALEKFEAKGHPMSAVFGPGRLPVVIEHPEKQRFSLSKCSLGLERLETTPLLEGTVDIMASEGNVLAMGLRGRLVRLVDLATLSVTDTVKVPGSGIMRQIYLKGQRMVCPSDGGLFHEYLVEGGKAILLGSFTGPSGTVHYLNWLDERTCIVCNDYQLWAFNPTRADNEPLLSFHALTCCGIDLFQHSDSEFDLAAGDFSGQVVLWKPHEAQPYSKTMVNFPIRSLKWLPSGAGLVIGDLEGHIHLWTPSSDLSSVWKLEGGITSIDIAEDKAAGLLKFAFGSTAGLASVLCLHAASTDLSGDFPNAGQRTSWVAHHAQTGPQDLNFGSINLYAEVWSLTWSPSSEFLATCSEDQSVAVWRIQPTVAGDPERVVSLRGHSAAVTCVKWKQSPTLGEIIVSASDDQTLRIWKAGSWDALATLTTKDNPFDIGWHTITYCDMEPGRGRITCGTSNGYLFCWDPAKERPFQFGRKMHAGSIEGMCWNNRKDQREGAAEEEGSFIATCSSDCTVQVFRWSDVSQQKSSM